MRLATAILVGTALAVCAACGGAEGSALAKQDYQQRM
jgi:hypothetical protein